MREGFTLSHLFIKKAGDTCMLSLDFIQHYPSYLYYDNRGFNIVLECCTAIDEAIQLQQFEQKSIDTYTNTAKKYIVALQGDISSSQEKELMMLVNKLEDVYSDYYVNYLHILKKYKNEIKQEFNIKELSLDYESYSYVDFDVFPKNSIISYKERLVKFAESCGKYKNERELSTFINSKIEDVINTYSEDILGTSISTNDIGESLHNICLDELRGDISTHNVSRVNLTIVIANLEKIVNIKKFIRQMRTAIPKTFENIHNEYESALQFIRKANSIERAKYVDVDIIKNPVKAIVLARYDIDTTHIDLAFNSLATYFSKIQYIIFKTKIEVMIEKVEMQRDLIKNILELVNMNTIISLPENLKSYKNKTKNG